ncbi:type II toxin-antitoxin system mRNA interferase toxin, RelE/StbE family [Pseudomonas sp. NPDC007930]|uniref:type II toxin-antitoxin system YafQ family toxin n=1 Tax=Pseudomonas sp. NPDC007930 TaxID=3364417 RepID=UPI0036EA12C5
MGTVQASWLARHEGRRRGDGPYFSGQPLPAEYLDHELLGNWAGARECHIGGDFLLIYIIEGNRVTFVDLGSHSELFK